MVATVKIIPFAVPETAVEAAAAFASDAGKLLRVAAFVPCRVALIQTRLQGFKESILEKTREVTEQRLAALGCALLSEERCAHEAADLAPRIAGAIAAGADGRVHGASAIVDRRDVIPHALVLAGGHIDHFGMPVSIPQPPAPRPCRGGSGCWGSCCARSPKVNGFDWVLERLVAGLPVGPNEDHGHGRGRPSPKSRRAGEHAELVYEVEMDSDGGLSTSTLSTPSPRSGTRSNPARPDGSHRIAAVSAACGAEPPAVQVPILPPRVVHQIGGEIGGIQLRCRGESLSPASAPRR